MDIKGRDGPAVTELCDAFNADNTDTVGTSGLAGEVNVTKRMQKTRHCGLWDTIKLIYDKDDFLIVKKTREVFKELPHFNVVGYPRIL